MKRQLRDSELQVARLVALGLTNAEIAAQVYRAEGTVKTHVSNIMRITGVHTRAALVAEVWRSGLLRLPLETQ